METTLKHEAKKIGRREANIALYVAFGIDTIIILYDGPKSFVVNGLFFGVLVWMLAMIFIGRILAAKSAVRIIVHKDGFAWAGIWCFLLTMASSVFVGCLATVLADAWNKGHLENFTAGYLFGTPLFVMIYSFIPISVHGIWFGYRIYNRGKSLSKNQNHDGTKIQD